LSAVFVPGAEWRNAVKTLKNSILCHQAISDHVTFSLLIPLSHPPDEEQLNFLLTKNDRCQYYERTHAQQESPRNYDNIQVILVFNPFDTIMLG